MTSYLLITSFEHRDAPLRKSLVLGATLVLNVACRVGADDVLGTKKTTALGIWQGEVRFSSP
jgi:hypothetical protein